MKPRKSASKRKPARSHAAAAGRKRHEKTPEWAELFKPLKKPVTLRVDADVLAWFKKQGRGYQTRINRALRQLMEEK
jgi:uncharacterized protein (DUF4415 family)